MSVLDQTALDQLFLEAHTHNKWQSRDVDDATLHRLADLTKMGPTSVNCSPARIVFAKSHAAREKLSALASEGNKPKILAAPVCAIIGYDTEFYEKLPQLMPAIDARSWFVGKPAHIEATAFRNSSLQAGYFILAARALGLDTGPMSGFEAAKVDEAFFPTGKVTTNLICNLGYGDPTGIYARAPRMRFDEFCSIA